MPEQDTPQFEFKVGDHIWNREFPFVVGTVVSLGKVGSWDAYRIRRDDNSRPALILTDEARAAG